MRKIQIILLLGIQVFYASSQDLVPRFPIYYKNSSNANCREDSSLLEQGLKDNILWAMQMWDASVKSGVGIVSGSLLQYGDFDECLAVKEPIKAKYCLLTVTLLKPSAYNSTDPYTIDYSPYVPVWEKLNDRGIISKQQNNVINWALCVPSSCTEYDILESLNEFIIQEKLNSSISISFSPGACSQIDDNRFTPGDLVFCFLIGIYVFGVLLVTIYDYHYFDAVEEKPNNVFLCFSLRRSVKSLMKKNQPITGYNIHLLSGIYVFSTILIMFGHRFGMFQVGGISNYDFVEKSFKYVEFSMWSSHIAMMVDCFFTLSGFLAGVILPFYYDNYKTSIVKVIINRYIRLVPSLLVVIFFYATIFSKIGDGPMWNTVLRREKQFCAENWWTSLLFISNYVNSERYCMVQTWYLNCDFQLFVITTVIFYLWKKRPAVVQFSLSALIILCLLSVLYACYAWELTALSLFYKRIWDNVRGYDYFLIFNIKTQFRAAPYLIGFITGYTLYIRKPNKVSQGETNSLFLGGALIMFMAYSSGYLFSDPAQYHIGIASSVYTALCNAFWAVGLLMIVISLLIGSASSILKVFSWDFLIPISKLSYNVYLVHMIFQLSSAASRRTPNYIFFNEWISRTISDLVFSLCAAFLLNVFFEAPCRYFVKYITFKKEKTKGNAPV